MKFLISGASGFIGSALARSLEEDGHDVRRLVRDANKVSARAFYWNPYKGEIDLAGLSGVDVIVHLAGDNIGSGRWTAAKKRRIRESRVGPTRFLSETMARLVEHPALFISASAVGIYGDRGAEVLSESSPVGSGFLAEVCQAWETATEAASRVGIRRVLLRLGLVLSADGGALAAMLRPFRLGFGGVIGGGEQFMSWITREDLLGVIRHICQTPTLHGPINAVSPNPVTNRTFTKTLAAVLKRPSFACFPAPLARILFGEMAKEALLSSARVVPKQLQDVGYRFAWPELEPALANLIKGTH